LWDLKYPGVRAWYQSTPEHLEDGQIERKIIEEVGYKALDTQGPILPRHLIWKRKLQKIIDDLLFGAMNYDK
jgi:hypothetical protein